MDHVEHTITVQIRSDIDNILRSTGRGQKNASYRGIPSRWDFHDRFPWEESVTPWETGHYPRYLSWDPNSHGIEVNTMAQRVLYVYHDTAWWDLVYRGNRTRNLTFPLDPMTKRFPTREETMVKYCPWQKLIQVR